MVATANETQELKTEPGDLFRRQNLLVDEPVRRLRCPGRVAGVARTCTTTVYKSDCFHTNGKR